MEEKSLYPELSIIVPVYKVERFLQECIDSILNQTFTDFELILVDDGSPDACPQICDAAAEKDPRVRVLHKENGGLSSARNAGMEAARGRWLGFVDSDDFVAKDFYRKLYDAATAANADCAVCSIRLTDEDGRPMETPREYAVHPEICTGREALQTIRWDKNTVYVMAQNKIYKREVFRTLRYPEGRLNEDNFVFAPLYGAVGTLAPVEEPLYFYRQRQNSIMHSQHTLRNLDHMWSFAASFDDFYAQGERELLAAAEGHAFAKLAGAYYQLTPADRRSPEMKRAKQKQRELVKILRQEHQLSARTLFRTVLFQCFPAVYGLRLKMGR